MDFVRLMGRKQPFPVRFDRLSMLYLQYYGEVVENEGKHRSGVIRTGLAMFEKIVPIPMRFPGESLVEKGRKVWTLFD